MPSLPERRRLARRGTAFLNVAIAAAFFFGVPSPAAAPGAEGIDARIGAAADGPAKERLGWDISWPQCGKPFPDTASFRIVGVNGGRPFRPNPCLGAGGRGPSQLEWAGRWAQLYVNTGNPGPELARNWPRGQVEPRECDTEDAPGVDTVGCSYDYGWNAAADAWRTVVDAFVSLGWSARDAARAPASNHWWLDVETGNTWRSTPALNVAMLQGAVDYLESKGVQRIGFYSTPYQWHRITRSSQAFADYPAWHAGGVTLAGAKAKCSERAFTGGTVVMTQFFDGGFDANYRCP
jgi:hypothetical protein